MKLRDKNKSWIGHPPAHGMLIAENASWALYTRGTPGSYVGIKIIATTPHARKANYWLSWRRGDARFIAGADALILCMHHKDIHDWALLQLQDHFRLRLIRKGD